MRQSERAKGYIPEYVLYRTEHSRGQVLTTVLRGTKANMKTLFNEAFTLNPILDRSKNEVFHELRFLSVEGSRVEPEFMIMYNGLRIRVDSFFMGEAMLYANVQDGVIKGSFQWAIIDGGHYLLCTNGPRHKKLVARGDVESSPVPMSELAVGDVRKNRRGNRFVYFGRIEWGDTISNAFAPVYYNSADKINGDWLIDSCDIIRHNDGTIYMRSKLELVNKTLYNKVDTLDSTLLSECRNKLIKSLEEVYGLEGKVKWLN